MLRKTTITLTGITDTDYSPTAMNGLIEYFSIAYTNGNATTGDLTLTDEETGISVYAVTDTATDYEGPVRAQISTNAGTAVTAYDKIPVTSRLKAVSAAHNSNTQIDIIVWWSE